MSSDILNCPLGGVKSPVFENHWPREITEMAFQSSSIDGEELKYCAIVKWALLRYIYQWLHAQLVSEKTCSFIVPYICHIRN